ncbi:hypothetical protein CISG_05557 [Coccidioides immitis RMSCC 3703]|uniref:Uncharacterized protein n=2 Tax=Coccidioides immitis TaxID=5501 RepID=A0A0J8QTI5_COCIT|nr:hypothetical protein CIRG_02782 [Coccidioides immitis RMSCC 2394]KMU76189.1 hypothetical protein CISG_05557 [Coccidioides immitis RMSCC 3703]
MAANGHSAGDGSSPGSPKELKLQPACVEPRQAELTAMHELETELGDGFQNVGRIASHQQGSPGTPDPSFDLREVQIILIVVKMRGRGKNEPWENQRRSMIMGCLFP